MQTQIDRYKDRIEREREREKERKTDTETDKKQHNIEIESQQHTHAQLERKIKSNIQTKFERRQSRQYIAYIH